MSLRLLPSVAVMLACAVRPATAGEIIRFEAGAPARTNVVLGHVPVKALVTEFLDPADTGVGKSVGYLVWRETLTAISDQAGAGIILARAPGEQRITDMLEKQYHEAAVRIASEQGAWMAVWGAVNVAGDDLYVSTYLSLLPTVANVQLKLRLSGEPPLPPGLEAEITRTNFNFPVVETTRTALFARRIVTRRQTTLHAKADASSASVARLATAKALDAVDMDKGWFKVRLEDGRFGFVDNAAVDVPPRTVEAKSVTTTLQTTPGGPRLRSVTLDGSYRVLDMRYIERSGLWYQLEVGGTPGWVRGSLVRARFSLPIVHFVAGLYRYVFKRYEDARGEFAQYASAPGAATDNATLAATYQLLGASTLLTKSSVSQTDPRVQAYFDQAVTATPYDPVAYSMRALSTLAVRGKVGGALPDLEQALRLDPTNAAASRITGTLHEQLLTPSGGRLRHMVHDGNQPEVQHRLADIVGRYPEAAKAVGPR